MDCLNEKVLSSYVDEKLSDIDKGKIESHISKCDKCLELLLLAYEAQGVSRKCPASLKENIKRGLNLRRKKKRPELKWLFGALALFIMSFVVRRFFLQFLSGAVILGFKWVMEGEGARRVVMIFKGMKKEDKEYPSPRFKSDALKSKKE